MEIIRAKTAGFCFGVDRAVKLTYDLLAQGRKVATLGPLIHNAQVVADLEAKGAVTCPDIDAVPDGYEVIIRSHGVPRSVYDKISTRSLAYHDATCPFVAKIHKIAMEADKNGALLLVAGDADHPEVQGINSYKTNAIAQDNNLVTRLEDAGVEFGTVYQPPTIWDSLLNLLISFLPMIILLWFVNRWASKKMQEMGGAGGNAMLFGGKSGAKQYVVDDETGIKFNDVAGEDEAKESLQEIDLELPRQLYRPAGQQLHHFRQRRGSRARRVQCGRCPVCLPLCPSQ